MRRTRAVATAIALTAAIATANAYADEGRVFRPLTADARESQSRWRIVDFTEDWRYGTDITDSTSVGGVEEDHHGVGWEVSGGETFRWRPLERLARWRGPWVRHQLGAPAAFFANFDGTGSLLDSDYQFGASWDVQWNGPWTPGIGVASYDRPVWTSRFAIVHRSSHLGDEYLTLSRYGRNQDGHPLSSVLFHHPPVKRVELSYEAVTGVASVEWAMPPARAATLRAYAGGEAKIVFPDSWGIGRLSPRRFSSPTARVGLELRSAGNRARPADGGWLRFVNAIMGDGRFAGEWFGAFDLRLAKPFDFASCDNPCGCGETWVPRMWTECPYGKELAYAGSWHGMLGVALTPRDGRAAGRLIGPEWLLSLEWYRGYSPAGQFLDQRLEYHPRWYVVPSVTAHF